MSLLPTIQPTTFTNTTTDDYYYSFKEGLVWSRGNTIIMFALSLSSVLLPLSAMLSILLFKRERNKSSMRILLYKFTADILTSAGSTVGNPYSASRACWFEGIVTNIFTLASILWTGVIMLVLYSVLAFKKPLGDHWAFHVICWGLPVIATVIPFSTSTYGAPGGMGWCWVVSKDDNPPSWEPQLWYWLSFYLYVWATMIFILAVSLRIIFHLRSPDIKEKTRDQFFQVFYKLLGYPAIIFICWLPSTVSDYIQNVNPDAILPDEFLVSTTSLDCLMGALSGFYFWLMNRTMYENWKNLYSVGFDLYKYDAQFNKSTNALQSQFQSSVKASLKSEGPNRSRGSISNSFGGLVAILGGSRKEEMVYVVDDDDEENNNGRSVTPAITGRTGTTRHSLDVSPTSLPALPAVKTSDVPLISAPAIPTTSRLDAPSISTPATTATHMLDVPPTSTSALSATTHMSDFVTKEDEPVTTASIDRIESLLLSKPAVPATRLAPIM